MVTLKGHPEPKARDSSWEEPPMPKASGGGQEELPRIQGAVAAWAQEGLKELFHVQGQEGRQ